MFFLEFFTVPETSQWNNPEITAKAMKQIRINETLKHKVYKIRRMRDEA